MSIESDIRSKGFINKQEKLFVNLIFTGFLFYKHINVFLKEYGLTEPQYNVLKILEGQFPSKILFSDLQSRMLHQSSNATRLINKLIEKELVVRIQDKRDKRQYLHSITPLGLALLDEIRPHIIQYCIDSFNVKEEEVDQLSLLLDEVRNIIL